MDVQFVASFSPIVADPSAARAFYQEALGLSFEGEADDYVFTEALGGVKHFGLWPLTEAAQACYGQPDWPSSVPVPQASLEFELPSREAVPAAAAELAGQGHRLHPRRSHRALGPDHRPSSRPRGHGRGRVLYALVPRRSRRRREMKPPVPDNPDQVNIVTGAHPVELLAGVLGSRCARGAQHRVRICGVGRNDPSPRSVRRYRRCRGTVRGPRLHRRELSINARAVVRLLYQPGHVGPPARSPLYRRCRGHGVRTRSG